MAENNQALSQRAYIWQRAWTDSVKRCAAEHASDFAALDVLLAEISWPANKPVTHRITPDWAALASSGCKVGLVVRIGPNSSPWDAASEQTQAVLATCHSVLAEARQHGVEPAELQIDFDATTARLDAYRNLLQIIRREVQPPRLTITTLPDWLRSTDFVALIRATDAYVLQVHSLEKPHTRGETYLLCDPTRATAWVAQAARLNHPFRIALPTYGYRLIYDADGRFTALEAEGPARIWPDHYQSRTITADAPTLATFVQQLLASPPPGCESLAWFRLPMENDELAWSWPTLRAVMQGQQPLVRLQLIAQPTKTGSLDLLVTNQGTASAEPAAFHLAWDDARLLASDSLAGWQIERPDTHTLIVRPPPHGSNGVLRPGESIQVGWLRLDHPTALHITLLP